MILKLFGLEAGKPFAKTIKSSDLFRFFMNVYPNLPEGQEPFHEVPPPTPLILNSLGLRADDARSGQDCVQNKSYLHGFPQSIRCSPVYLQKRIGKVSCESESINENVSELNCANSTAVGCH
jgi:hypothetical protein